MGKRRPGNEPPRPGRAGIRAGAVVPTALWLLPLLWLALVVVVLALHHERLLQPVPGNPVPAWLMTMAGLALVLAVPFLLLHLRHIRIVDGMLSIRAAAVFAHRVAPAELDLERARIVSLDEHDGFRPRVRLWGLRLPGFSAGHFLLRNRARAFCLLTRNDKVLVLPRHDGRLILLSPEKPQALLERLRGLAGTAARS